eukprot:8245100-Prorocentrum_lima.AAC.1
MIAGAHFLAAVTVVKLQDDPQDSPTRLLCFFRPLAHNNGWHVADTLDNVTTGMATVEFTVMVVRNSSTTKKGTRT